MVCAPAVHCFRGSHRRRERVVCKRARMAFLATHGNPLAAIVARRRRSVICVREVNNGWAGSGRGTADGCGTRTVRHGPAWCGDRPSGQHGAEATAAAGQETKMRHRYRFRSEDAAPQPFPKRICGAKAPTTSEHGPHSPPEATSDGPRHPATAAPWRAAATSRRPPRQGAASQDGPGASRGWGGWLGRSLAKFGADVGRSSARIGRHGVRGYPPGKALRAIANPTESRGVKSDAGWLRGQTTRRRIHRRSDGGPERRHWYSGGGPEHR